MRKKLMSCVSAITLLSASLYGFIGLQLGPFDLEFGVYQSNPPPVPPAPNVRIRQVSYDPICQSISQRQQLEMRVEWKEQISDREWKITVKNIVVEPYLFGKKKNGQLILRGNVVSEKLEKELTLKVGEGVDQDNHQAWVNPNETSVYTGTYAAKRGTGIETLNFEKISSVRVLPQRFDPPQNFNDVFQDDVAEVICTITSVPSQGRR